VLMEDPLPGNPAYVRGLEACLLDMLGFETSSYPGSTSLTCANSGDTVDHSLMTLVAGLNNGAYDAMLWRCFVA
jgi:hypothetical protein